MLLHRRRLVEYSLFLAELMHSLMHGIIFTPWFIEDVMNCTYPYGRGPLQ